MKKKLFLKIWTGVLSSLTLANADAIADVPHKILHNDGNDTQISIKESKAIDLFLHHAKEVYSDQMLFAGHSSHSSHASHSSHRSHYSSSTYQYTPPAYSTPSTATPKKETSPSKAQPLNSKSNASRISPDSTKKYNIADVKMVQITLNTLGYNAGKVDGREGKSVRAALNHYQKAHGLQANGKLDSQTCISLAKTIKEKFPEDENAKKMYHNLMRLYLKLSLE